MGDAGRGGVRDVGSADRAGRQAVAITRGQVGHVAVGVVPEVVGHFIDLPVHAPRRVLQGIDGPQDGGHLVVGYLLVQREQVVPVPGLHQRQRAHGLEVVAATTGTLPRLGRDEGRHVGGGHDGTGFEVVVHPFLEGRGHDQTVGGHVLVALADLVGGQLDGEDAGAVDGQLDELLPKMEALGQGPRLEVHRGGFAVGIPQHRAAILAGLVALDVPLGHGVAVGVVLLEVGQAQLGLYLAAHTHGHVLEHGLGGEGVDGGTQGDEGGHVGGYVLEQGHGHVPAPGSAAVGLLHEGGDGGGEGSDATLE